MSTEETTMQCEGACEEHIGPVRTVIVGTWGEFKYCSAAIEEDRRRGLTVTEQKDALRKEAVLSNNGHAVKALEGALK